jgi:hypothetical protein
MNAMSPALKRQLVTVNARTFTRSCLRVTKLILTQATHQYIAAWPKDNFHNNIIGGGRDSTGVTCPFFPKFLTHFVQDTEDYQLADFGRSRIVTVSAGEEKRPKIASMGLHNPYRKIFNFASLCRVFQCLSTDSSVK